jgi:chemotaxis protein MotB
VKTKVINAKSNRMRLTYVLFFMITVAIASCVPLKKYHDVAEKARLCEEELNALKDKAINNENKANELESQLGLLTKEATQLRQDTTNLGEKLRLLKTQYQKMVDQNLMYEKKLEHDRQTVAKSAGSMQADMDAKSIELQRKQDELKDLEDELFQKQKLLEDREKRVQELEEMLQRKDEAVKMLKKKIADALLGYKNKGLSVEERNGKIYVSLDAKLLFKTGSTQVETEGKKALVDLARVLEKEKDMEIIVEGHTDTDKLTSPNHPKNNWELSVLRATSVVEILTGNSTMNPGILMAAGRSEFHPVDPNDKAKNRRIDIIISPNLNALFELISK